MKKERAKTLLLFIVLFFAGGLKFLFAQVTAGSVPIGTSILNPNINLSINVVNQDTTVYLDLDCGFGSDLGIYFTKGATAVDGPNVVMLYIQNKSLEICTDTGSRQIPVYYNPGDTLCNDDARQWSTDTILLAGCNGSFGCVGHEYAVTNKYLAYKSKVTQQTGWIKISFDLQDGGDITSPITLSVDEVLIQCDPNGIAENANDLSFKIYPNPVSSASVLQFNATVKNTVVSMYDLLGKELWRKSFTGGKMKIEKGSLERGIYFVKVGNGNTQYIQKIVVD